MWRVGGEGVLLKFKFSVSRVGSFRGGFRRFGGV